jgi:hypothetical protein
MKDKFSILVVDEPKGVRFFTKIDLRSGYHQVCMHHDDTEKMTFRTHQGHFEFTVMPFGLTNVLATFQSLMNTILKPYIHTFMLAFFDDILIYSSSWAEHLQYVKMVFDLMWANHLYIKLSKCAIGGTNVAYLGYIVLADGVVMDLEKVSAVHSWPQPHTIQALRHFLGLMGYYRKFIIQYGEVARPLTALLKKDSFSWTLEADRSFQDLKHALMTAPLLQLPDFDKKFVVECDASGSGFGAVLHQDDGPVAFFSGAVAAHHAKLPVYERELIGLVKAVRHWRPYLWVARFSLELVIFSQVHIGSATNHNTPAYLGKKIVWL